MIRDIEDHLRDRPSVEEIEVDLTMKHNDKHHTALLARVSKFLPAETIDCLAHRKDRAKASLSLAEHSDSSLISHT